MSPHFVYIFQYFLLPFTLITGVQIKLHFEPIPDGTTSGLIWFNPRTYTKWSQQLDNYLEVYRSPQLTEGRVEHLTNCSYDKPINDNTVCDIKPDINPCTASNHFGYKHSSPCVFIAFEKLLDWKPKFYNSTKSLPKKMPGALRELISGTANNLRKWETVWLWCDGETAADKEMIGPISYFPRAGFPGFIFPYTGQQGYLSPIVAVHFERPITGIVINVICSLWGPNIMHDHHKQIGLVKFNFLIDV